MLDAAYIKKILTNIEDGKYSLKELDNLYRNAQGKGIVEIQEAIKPTKPTTSKTALFSVFKIKRENTTIPKKLGIVGNRHLDNYEIDYAIFCKQMEFILNEEVTYDTIVSGGAKGIDTFARTFAFENNFNFIEIKPDWKLYGRGAGLRGNQEIVDCCDELVAFWNGISSGTKSSVELARKSNKLLRIYHLSSKNDNQKTIEEKA